MAWQSGSRTERRWGRAPCCYAWLFGLAKASNSGHVPRIELGPRPFAEKNRKGLEVRARIGVAPISAMGANSADDTGSVEP